MEKQIKNNVEIKEVNLLTDSVLIDLLNTTKSTICSITYIVDDKRSKTINKKSSIQKEVRIKNLFLNHSYTNKIKKLTGNDDFKAQPLKGKTRISSTLIQSDSSKELMIDGKVLDSNSVEIIGYYYEGKKISEAEITNMDLWTNSYYIKPDKKTMGRGLVNEEDNFKIINTSLSKIMSIHIFGKDYVR